MTTKVTPHYIVSGRITDRQGEPLPDLTVRAYDQDPQTPDNPLGKAAVTGAQGRYTIRFTEQDFKIGGFESGGPDVFIRVFDGESQLGESPVRRNAGKRITINLKLAAGRIEARPKPAYCVSGLVRQGDGRPLAGAVVRAYDQGLRTTALLAESKTGPDGRYLIGYDTGKLLEPKRGSANLRVEVVAADGHVLASSAVRFNAGAQETIDLALDAEVRRSDWERMESRLQPALQGARLIDLSVDEFAFLEKSARLPAEQLRPRAQAAKAASETGLPEWFHYALLRQGLPGERTQLLDTPLPRMREALAAACKAGVVDAADDKEMAAIWQGLETLQTDQALDKPLPGRRLRVRQVLEVAGLDPDQQRIFAKSMTPSDLASPAIWATLPRATGLDEPTLARVRFALSTAELADDHLATMTALRNDERVCSLRDLAKYYGPEDWQKLVNETMPYDGDGQPADVPGKTADEHRMNFARRLSARVAQACPDTAVVYGLGRRPGLAQGRAARLLPKLLESDEGFDLASVRMDAYVREHQEVLGIQDESEEQAVRDDLKRVQRVYRLRAEPEAVARLLEGGLDSSAAILRRGREAFLAEYGREEALGQEIARGIYARAEANAAKAFAIYARFSPIIHPIPGPSSIGTSLDQLQGIPNYSTLFGSLDSCACEPCESVYSPAAYLTDLLAFLETAVKPAPGTPPESGAPADGLAALESRSFADRHNRPVVAQTRRPDILDIKLSCRNAETPVPYVDLVLEVLENAVASRHDGTPQTTLTAEQLAEQPEYFILGAYVELARAVYPFGLPFDVWQEQATMYLERLGTSRVELIEMYFPFDPPQDGEPADQAQIRCWQNDQIAAATLGLTDFQWELIRDPSLHGVRAAWGNMDGSDDTWWQPLCVADTLLERTGLGYDDLLRLLTLKSFNPQGEITLKFAELNDCDPKKITIVGLDLPALAFLHRFLRLQRALGWSLQELDQAVSSLSPRLFQGRPALKETFLLRLSHLVRLRNRFGVPLPEILSWWSHLDTADYNAGFLPRQWPRSRSLYETLFQSGRAGEPLFDAFQLNAARSNLKDKSRPLADYAGFIANAFGVSQADLSSSVTGPIGNLQLKLTLPNLSFLYRHASLARALHLTLADYLTLRTLIGFDPFTASGALDGTVQTLRFVERAELVQGSGFSIAELDYILRQTAPFESEKTIAPAGDWIANSLAALKTAVQAAAPFNVPRLKLHEVLTRVEATSGPAATADELRPLIEKARELLSATGQAGSESTLETTLAGALALVAPGATVDQAALSARLVEALTILTAALRSPMATALRQVLAVPGDAADALLRHVLSPNGDAVTAEETLIRVYAPVDDGAGAAPAQDELQNLMVRLHKAALLVARLGITGAELDRLAEHESAGWLDLASLPVAGTMTAPPFESWCRLVRLFQFRDSLPQDQQDGLFNLFAMAKATAPKNAPFERVQRQAYADSLARITAWNKADIEALVVYFGSAASDDSGIWKANFERQFAGESLPYRLMAAITVLRRIGASASEASAWASLQDLSSTEKTVCVAQIHKALKVRSGQAWSPLAKQLRDPLRERQRLALVAWLLQNWHLTEPADLHDHFLLDVEMSPSMMTSRLMQATASVQLFVQRVLLNLEPGLSLSDEGAEQWEWMKNYRVWEANRKIFLYPENWIEPELRDDKTPFFKDLEKELLQADISNETAETALLHYLEKLHEVARLQVCGQYLEAGNPILLHVFARTRDVPHHYYYRRGVLKADVSSLQSAFASDMNLPAERMPWASMEAGWTPWERVNVDVEGDHLIPVVYNRRLYLFWPIFTERDEAPFSQLEKQVIELFRFNYQLQLCLIRLEGEMAALVQSVIAGAAGAILDGLNQVLAGLDYLRTELSSFNTRFDDVQQRLDARIEHIDQEDDLRDALQKVSIVGEGLDKLYGMLRALSEAVMNEGSATFARVDRLFSKPVPMIDVSVSLPAPASDPKTHIGNIVTIIRQIEELISPLLTNQFLSLAPAKRLEVQLAWSEYKNDGWSAKKTSAGLVSIRDVISLLLELAPPVPGAGKLKTKRLFTFSSEVDGNNRLFIHCHIGLPDQDQAWRLTPIGYFRMHGGSGRLEAVDLPEDQDIFSILETFTRGLEASLQAQIAHNTDEMHGIPQLQTGEPVTPDDDPDRPSSFRLFLEQIPLPGHSFQHKSVLTGQDMKVGDTYRVLARHQDDTSLYGALRFVPQDLIRTLGFFYQDAERSYFCFPWPLPKDNPKTPTLRGEPYAGPGFVFLPFYHPYTCALLENIQRFGIPGIYGIRYVGNGHDLEPDLEGEPLQIALKDEQFFSPDEYTSIDCVYNPPGGDPALRPIEEINFSAIGAYAQYNWELFFHIPFLVASRLSTNQKFREAQHWFHFIFNPTDAARGEAPRKYWRTRPFVEAYAADYQRQEIEQLLQMVSAAAETPGVQEIERAVDRWRRDAFNPYLVARTRTAAFQKAVVMKYIDNLIAWGDSLFRQENINEATQLYILAAKLLGPRPRSVPKAAIRPELSYSELSHLDAFSNSLVEIESLLPAAGAGLNVGDAPCLAASRGPLDRTNMAPVDTAWRGLVQSRSLQAAAVAERQADGTQRDTSQALYFGVPPNDKLLAKWDLVADRLFKIRHCQNIEGRVLQLPLPPIGQGTLDRAKALGVDLNDVLIHLYAPLPPYRFRVLAQKATELCGEVKALGSALLSALEKRDGEALALLRNTQEIALLEAVRAVKVKQVDEATKALEGLGRTQEATTIRRDHYARLLAEDLNPEEIAHIGLGAASLALQVAQFGLKVGSSAASLIPNLKAGFGTTAGATTGGQNAGDSAERAADAIGHLASILSSTGGLILTMGGYRRRAEDWLLQVQLANKEIEGIAQQILAAEIRLEIAELDLDNHKLQISNSREANDFMQQKFTNQELYDWMIGQIAGTYFQSYQLAFDVVKQAESCFQFEIGEPAATFVRFGYWDSLKMGLLAGERLANDLRRMEVAYLAQNTRDLEITKHVSLAQVLPLRLMELKESGSCTVELPEWLFDMDYPGHYRRRLKSVSISIPCVTGPYTSVNCTLSLRNHGIRINENVDPVTGGYGDPLVAGDPRFYRSPAPVTAIATSHGQNDAGMFELNFSDERFLPFEGAGAVSEWHIDLPKKNNQFDLATISDVILHIRYTARPSSRAQLIQTARDNVKEVLPQEGRRLLVLNHEFGTAWYRFLHPDGGADQILSFTLGREHLPFYAHDMVTINLTALDLILEGAQAGSFDVKLTAPGAATAGPLTTSQRPEYGVAEHLAKTDNAVLLGDWQIQIKKTTDRDFKSLKPEDIQNAYLVVSFKSSPP